MDKTEQVKEILEQYYDARIQDSIDLCLEANTYHAVMSIKEYYEKQFNPDYLDFQEGVELGRQMERQKVLKEVESTLGISENELGFIEISNHVPFSNWVELKQGQMPGEK